MNLSFYAANTMLSSLAALYNGASLDLYNGPMPFTPEKALSSNGTNTLLASFTFSNPAFGTVGGLIGRYAGTTALGSFVTNPVTPTASGVAFFGRVTATNSSVIEDRTVAQGWTSGLAVSFGQFIIANGNTYYCMAGGTTGAAPGPSGLGSNIPDGTAAWSWYNAGSADILLTSSLLSTSTPLQMPYYWIALPCV